MPNVNELIVTDPVLSGVSQKYKNGTLIADKIMPIIPTATETGKYFIYGKEHLDRVYTKRAPKTAARQVDWHVTSDTFRTEEYALSEMIDDRERAVVEGPISLEVDTIELLTDLMQLDYEIRVATMLTDASIITNTEAVATKWTDDANAKVYEKIRDWKKSVEAACGTEPNTMILPKEIWVEIRTNAQLLAMLPQTAFGVLTVEAFQKIVEIDNILICNGKYNTAAKGAAPTLANVWGKNVLLAYVTPRPGLKTLSLGYTFRKGGWTVRRWREEKIHCDAFEVSVNQDEKLMAAECAFLATGVIA